MPWNEPGSGKKDPWGSNNNGSSNGGNRGQAPDIEKVIDNVYARYQ